MLKFLIGILAVQAITALLVLVIPVDISEARSWLKLATPLAALGALAAFWFGLLASQMAKEKVARLKHDFADEREKLRVNAERAKTRLVKQSYKEIARESRRVRVKANMKVGLAFAGALGAGVVLLATEFMTMGLLTLTTAGGALGGYLIRAGRDKKLTVPIDKPARAIGGKNKTRLNSKKLPGGQK